MGMLYLIPNPHRMEESAELAERTGACFEYNDFFSPQLLDNREMLAERIRMYASLSRDRSRDTLHGAFFDVTVHSDDPGIREVSEKRIWQSMECAQTLGVRAVIFHTGTIPNFSSAIYESNWLERNSAFFRRVAQAYPNIGILMENMFDMRPDLLSALAAEMQDVQQFGVCLDWSHAAVFGSSFGEPEAWFDVLAPYIRHLHINDHDGLRDLHLPVGEGITNWTAFSEKLRSGKAEPSVLIETTSTEAQLASLKYMKEKGIYPFN